MPDIFLNCDLNESLDPQHIAKLMPHLHMASLRCHSQHWLKQCAETAEQTRCTVSTGALFYLPTPTSSLSSSTLIEILTLQLTRFISAADLNHLKLEPALLDAIEHSPDLLRSFLDFVRSRCLISIVYPLGSNLAREAHALGLPTILEVPQDFSIALSQCATDDSLCISLPASASPSDAQRLRNHIDA